jgi:hypothetical protein
LRVLANVESSRPLRTAAEAASRGRMSKVLAEGTGENALMETD